MNRYKWVKNGTSEADYYWLWEKMPRIKDDLLDVVIYIFRDKDCTDKVGSGFLFLVEQNGIKHFYAVTNAHVVDKDDELHIRFNTQEGGTQSIPVKNGSWILYDEQDLAICPISPSRAWRAETVNEDELLTPELVSEAEGYNIGRGDDTTLLGMYHYHAGEEQNLPVVRFGHIAMPPIEPIPMFDDKTGKKRMIDGYLVEGHSIGGFSGSPVFIDTPTNYRPAKLRPNSPKTFLLGINNGHLNLHPVHEKHYETSGMMTVIASWNLKALINREDVVEQRKKTEELFKKKAQESEGSLDSMPSITDKEFGDVLRKVTRKSKPSEPDQSKPQT